MKKVFIENKSGVKEEVELVCAFNVEEENKKFVVIKRDEPALATGQFKAYVSLVNEENGICTLDTIEDQTLWEKVKKSMASIAHNESKAKDVNIENAKETGFKIIGLSAENISTLENAPVESEFTVKEEAVVETSVAEPVVENVNVESDANVFETPVEATVVESPKEETDIQVEDAVNSVLESSVQEEKPLDPFVNVFDQPATVEESKVELPVSQPNVFDIPEVSVDNMESQNLSKPEDLYKVEEPVMNVIEPTALPIDNPIKEAVKEEVTEEVNVQETVETSKDPVIDVLDNAKRVVEVKITNLTEENRKLKEENAELKARLEALTKPQVSEGGRTDDSFTKTLVPPTNMAA